MFIRIFCKVFVLIIVISKAFDKLVLNVKIVMLEVTPCMLLLLYIVNPVQ